MKKNICALILALLILALPAWAEETTPPAEEEAQTTETLEIIAVEVNPVNIAPAESAPAESAPAEAAATSTPTPAPKPVGVPLTFEDGFSLELPEGWLYHNLSGEMAEKGVLYCLSDASGAHWLYIHRWSTDCADMNDLSALITRATSPQTSGVYNFNGTDFLVYDLTDGDVSCCAALMDGYILNFVFTPQSDADYMAAAAAIMSTFSTTQG